MNRIEIYDKVIESADKHGSTNPQIIKHLRASFRRVEAKELFEGLFKVFLNTDGDKFNRQQLSGKLLHKIQPRTFIDLADVIKSCLDTWDVSVEELPFYFRDVCGIERVVKAFNIIRVANLNENEINSLETMEWWLGIRTNG